MMSPEQVVHNLFAALEARRYTEALSYIADTFVNTGSLPGPLNKYQWVANLQALINAMPDLQLGLSSIQGAGSRLQISLQLRGTHTAQLKFPTPGMPCLPPSGRTITLPRQRAQVTVKDGEVVALHLERMPNGGIPGILHQMSTRLAS